MGYNSVADTMDLSSFV